MPKSFVQSRNCPSCGENPVNSVLEVQAKVVAENLSNEALSDFFIGFRKEQCFFSYHRCNNCGLLYCPKYFTKEALVELYSSMPENTSVSGERDSIRTQQKYTKYFNKQNTNQSYLEIGADIGLLASAIKAEFNVSKIAAIEPNLSVHEMLRENLSSEVSIFTDKLQIPHSNLFDMVAAIHVIDHLLYPSEDLTFVNEMLSKEGQFLIVVHDEKSVLRKLLGQKWPPFCLQHPQLFNKKSIKNLLANNNLRVSRISKTSNYMSIRHGYSLLQSIGVMPNINLKIWDISLPIKLGNLAVIAQKNLSGRLK